MQQEIPTLPSGFVSPVFSEKLLLNWHLRRWYQSLPNNGRLLDVGCANFTQHDLTLALGRPDIRHAGIDSEKPAEIPSDVEFCQANLDLEPLPFPADTFDMVVASHILEHVRDPVRLFGECLRVLRPGGTLLVETPSERSLLLPGFPIQHDQSFSWSFFDDPTHLGRPFSPQSLVRLANCHEAVAVYARHRVSILCRLALPVVLPLALLFRVGWLLQLVVWEGVGWCSQLIAQKPAGAKGKPLFRYHLPPRRYQGFLFRVLERPLRRIIGFLLVRGGSLSAGIGGDSSFNRNLPDPLGKSSHG